MVNCETVFNVSILFFPQYHLTASSGAPLRFFSPKSISVTAIVFHHASLSLHNTATNIYKCASLTYPLSARL